MPKRGDCQPTEPGRPIVRVKHHSYQPSKAELEAEIELPEGTTPEDLARAAVTPVTVIEE